MFARRLCSQQGFSNLTNNSYAAKKQVDGLLVITLIAFRMVIFLTQCIYLIQKTYCDIVNIYVYPQLYLSIYFPLQRRKHKPNLIFMIHRISLLLSKLNYSASMLFSLCFTNKYLEASLLYYVKCCTLLYIRRIKRHHCFCFFVSSTEYII